MSGYFIGKGIVEIVEGMICIPKEISKIDVRTVDLVFTVWEKENGEWDSIMIYMADSWRQRIEEQKKEEPGKTMDTFASDLLTERKVACGRTNEYGEVKLPQEIYNRLRNSGETSVVLLGSMQKKLEMIGEKPWEEECAHQELLMKGNMDLYKQE